MARLLLVVGALALSFGLGRLSVRRAVPPRPSSSQAVRDTSDLEQSLSELEAKLAQGEQWVVENSELKRRHERVSALACTAAVAQRDDAVRLVREKARRRRRNAAADEDGEEQASVTSTTSVASHVLADKRTGAP